MKCGLCKMWGIDADAIEMRWWENGKELPVCESCKRQGAGLTKKPEIMVTEDDMITEREVTNYTNTSCNVRQYIGRTLITFPRGTNMLTVMIALCARGILTEKASRARYAVYAVRAGAQAKQRVFPVLDGTAIEPEVKVGDRFKMIGNEEDQDEWKRFEVIEIEYTSGGRVVFIMANESTWNQMTVSEENLPKQFIHADY